MQVSLNAITIKQASLMQKLEAAAEAGFDGIGLWNDEVSEAVQQGMPIVRIADALYAKRLSVPEMCFVGGWMYSTGEERSEALSQAQERFHQAAGLGCGCVIACASNGEGDLDEVADDYRELCTIAARWRVKPALEFVGAAQQVKDIATAWEVIRRAGHPMGSILLDTFHFHMGGSTIEDLKRVPAHKIALVHINDAPDKPLDQLSDADRLMPGDGVLPLVEILSILRDGGFQGHVSLELFNEEYWAMDPFEVAKIGYEKTKAVVDAAS